MKKVLSKNGLKLFYIFIVVFTLSGYNIINGESIDDCMTKSQCNYNEQSVRTEGSDMSNALIDLILNDEDDIIFNYMINPGGDLIEFIYVSDDVMTKTQIEAINVVLLSVIDVANEHYQFDEMITSITFGDTKLSLIFDEDSNITYLSADLDVSTRTNVDDFSEAEIMTNLQQNIDNVKLLLDFNNDTYLNLFGIGKIRILKEDSIVVQINSNIDSETLRDFIDELLIDYDFSYQDS